MYNTIELKKENFTREELGRFVGELLKADYIVVVDEDRTHYTIEYNYSPKLGFRELSPKWISKDEWKMIDKYRDTHERGE